MKPRRSIFMRSTIPILYRCGSAIKPSVGISRSNVMSRDRVDGQSFDDIEKLGRDQWFDELAEELRNETYQPRPVRRVDIPKGDGKQRPLGNPCIRDRVVQTATM